MKRGWIGLGLLAVMLAGGLLVTWHMGQNHQQIANDLKKAGRCALAENWEDAIDLAEDAFDDWEDDWRFSAAFADHEPMETIDALFAQLDTYRIARDSVSFSAICAELARQVEAMGDAHSLNWRNLL